MAERRLGPDEAALWARVKASVRPLAKPGITRPVRPEPVAERLRQVSVAPMASVSRASTSSGRVVESKPTETPNTLDGGWDRRLTRGIVVPDSTLDLHGHTLRSAHALLDGGIERAVARGDRVMLLVTGKPPRAESERPHARGAIRGHIADWLAHSRHRSSIAAVRNAHPRHGGQGALYLVFRRPKTRP